MHSEPKKTNDNQAEPPVRGRGQSKYAGTRDSRPGSGFATPLPPQGMNPATANFEPNVGSNGGLRWSPYPGAASAGCTYTNLMVKMEATVRHLEIDLAAQKVTASQELEGVKRELEETKQSIATKQSVDDVELGLSFEAIDMKDEIRQTKSNVAAVRDAAGGDLRKMYQMMMTMQDRTARLESDNQSMLAVMQGQRPALEASPLVKMIEAAAHSKAASTSTHPEQKLLEEATSKTFKDLPKQGDAGAAQARAKVREKRDIVQQDAQITKKITSTALVKTGSSQKDTTHRAWLPYALSQLEPTEVSAPSTHIYTFTSEYLQEYLGGSQLSPGLVFSDPSSTTLRGGAYWLLEGVYEPFAPVMPGAHGAKLTPFFNDDISGNDCVSIPVFVSIGKLSDYTYMGQYSQPRYSDRLSHSEMMDQVPKRVLRYWTENLADECRPEWLTVQLMEQLSPRPVFCGRPSASDTGSPGEERRVWREIDAYAVELRFWEKDARAQVDALTEADVAALWLKADADQPKGLRLWWEYLQCVGYDREFYQKLVELGIPKELKKEADDIGQGKEQARQVEEHRPSEAARGVAKQNKATNPAEKQGSQAVQEQEKQADDVAEKHDDAMQKKQETIESAPFSYEASFIPRKKRT